MTRLLEHHSLELVSATGLRVASLPGGGLAGGGGRGRGGPGWVAEVLAGREAKEVCR